MSWAVGRDVERQRHIGYGVPATCDHPGCGESIDRGFAYACGDPIGDEGCGLYFCGVHLGYFVEDDNDGGWSACERCASDKPPFDPTPDTAEWVEHVSTDESWQQWREENPDWLARMKREVTR